MSIIAFGKNPQVANEKINEKKEINLIQKKSENQVYIVKSGDALTKIAKEYLGSPKRWKDIAEANDLSNPNEIQEGQILIIPSSSSERGNLLHDIRHEPKLDSKYKNTKNGFNQDISQRDDYQNEVVGEVTNLKSDSDTINLRDENGNTHTLKLDHIEMLQGLEIGDLVKIEIEKGKAISLKKIGSL